MKSDSLQITEDYSSARATHPRVTLTDIEANIGHVVYFTAGDAVSLLSRCAIPDGDTPLIVGRVQQPMPDNLNLMTICLLTTQNGFTLIGKSAPASPENFDAEKGRTFAYEDAVRQLWPIMAYALREKLA